MEQADMLDKRLFNKNRKDTRVCADLVPLGLTYGVLELLCLLFNYSHGRKNGCVGSGISSVALMPTLILYVIREAITVQTISTVTVYLMTFLINPNLNG